MRVAQDWLAARLGNKAIEQTLPWIDYAGQLDAVKRLRRSHVVKIRLP